MTEAQFRSAVKVAVKRSDFEQGCSYLEPGARGISFMLLDSRIARVDITSGSWRTEAGAGIGTSETEIRRLYPAVHVEPHPYYDESTGHYFRVTPASPALRDYGLIFETERGAVTSFRAGLARAVSFVEGCA